MRRRSNVAWVSAVFGLLFVVTAWMLQPSTPIEVDSALDDDLASDRRGATAAGADQDGARASRGPEAGVDRMGPLTVRPEAPFDSTISVLLPRTMGVLEIGSFKQLGPRAAEWARILVCDSARSGDRIGAQDVQGVFRHARVFLVADIHGFPSIAGTTHRIIAALGDARRSGPASRITVLLEAVPASLGDLQGRGESELGELLSRHWEFPLAAVIGLLQLPTQSAVVKGAGLTVGELSRVELGGSLEAEERQLDAVDSFAASEISRALRRDPSSIVVALFGALHVLRIRQLLVEQGVVSLETCPVLAPCIPEAERCLRPLDGSDERSWFRLAPGVLRATLIEDRVLADDLRRRGAPR